MSSVYFIKAAGPAIKIGFATNVAIRIASLQTSSHEPLTLLASVAGDRALEKSLHQQFKHLKLAGEWFKDTPELRARIADLTQERKQLPLSLPSAKHKRAEIDGVQELMREYIYAIGSIESGEWSTRDQKLAECSRRTKIPRRVLKGLIYGETKLLLFADFMTLRAHFTSIYSDGKPVTSPKEHVALMLEAARAFGQARSLLKAINAEGVAA